MYQQSKLRNKYINILRLKTIEELLNEYEMIINSDLNLSELELEKVNRFFNRIYAVKDSFNKEEKEKYGEKFEKEEYLLYLIKRNLTDLLKTAKSIKNYYVEDEERKTTFKSKGF
jgi:hypothetical protein